MLKPLHDKVVIKRSDAETRSPGGLILINQDAPSEGTVLAVGPGKISASGERIPLTVEVNDVILFSKWTGSTIKVDGEELLIMSEDDILGIV